MSDTGTQNQDDNNKAGYDSFKGKTEYTRIKDQEYYKRFGVEINGSEFEISDKDKLEAAYEKAWENRNYEIDKFWSRGLYFWGFVAATFIAYTAIITSNSDRVKEIITLGIDISILALGVILSLAWLLVIKGSKRWQENWEKHIDYLENFVSGPIYKTIFYQGRHYSVSKMSENVAWTVLGVWCILLAQTLCERYTLSLTHVNLVPTIILALMVFMIVKMLIWGKREIFIKDGKKKETDFIYRKRRNDLETEEKEKKGEKTQDKQTEEKQNRSKSNKNL